MLIVGERELEGGALVLHRRGTRERVSVPFEGFRTPIETVGAESERGI